MKYATDTFEQFLATIVQLFIATSGHTVPPYLSLNFDRKDVFLSCPLVSKADLKNYLIWRLPKNDSEICHENKKNFKKIWNVMKNHDFH